MQVAEVADRPVAAELRRLGEADGEIAVARDSGCYPYFVVNDVLETTIQEVRSIIAKEQQEP